MTLIAVDGCFGSGSGLPVAAKAPAASPAPASNSTAAPLATINVGPVKTVNVTRRFTWSVTRDIARALTPLSVLSIQDVETQSFDHLVAFKRTQVPSFAKQYRVSGTVDITNPSDKNPLRITALQVLLRRMGSTDEIVPVRCKGGAANLALPPLGTVRCSYDAPVVEGRPGVAKVRATLADARVATSTAGGAFSFAKAPAVAFGECVNASDEFHLLTAPMLASAATREAAKLRTVGERPPAVRLGEAPVRLCASKEFKMAEQVGPLGVGRCGTYTYGGSAVAKPISGPQGPVATPNTKVLDVVVKC